MEKSRFDLVIPFEILIKNDIDHLQWFILYCCFKKDNKLISDYVKTYKAISTNRFLELENKGFINLTNKSEISLDSIKLTGIGKSLFIVDNDKFSDLFNDLLKTFPKKVPSAEGKSVRRLQGNIPRCKRLYDGIININGKLDIELHDKIIKAIKLMYSEHEKGRRLPFIQLLETFLHQKTFELYFDVESNEIKSNDENKTIIGNDDF